MTAAVAPRQGAWTRWLLVGGAAIAVAVGLDVAADRLGGLSKPDLSTLDPGGAWVGIPDSYGAELKRDQLAIDNAADRARAEPEQWIMHEALGRNLVARARLTGSFDDYAEAQRVLDRSLKLSPNRLGPNQSLATLDFTMHRLDAAEEQLDLIDRYGVEVVGSERAELLAMRGDIAFYRGDYAAALSLYDQADALSPGMTLFRRAVYASKTGDLAAADRLIDQAAAGARRPTRHQRASFELQHGLMELDRGRYAQALMRFRAADRLFPGNWLFHEHIAESLHKLGKLDAAARLYTRVIAATDGPEFMDALAGIEQERGNAAEAQRWRAKAAERWKKRIAQFPEAAYGHALDHCRSAGDWACALDLATRNHRARPYGEAKVLLAEALLHNRRLPEARAMIDQVLASVWRTPETHRVAAEIFEASGNAAAAADQRSKQQALQAMI